MFLHHLLQGIISRFAAKGNARFTRDISCFIPSEFFRHSRMPDLDFPQKTLDDATAFHPSSTCSRTPIFNWRFNVVL
jgi:hypothetical protein